MLLVMCLPTGYCYQANDALEESDILREFVNFILAFRVCIYNAMCVWLHLTGDCKHSVLSITSNDSCCYELLLVS